MINFVQIDRSSSGESTCSNLIIIFYEANNDSYCSLLSFKYLCNSKHNTATFFATVILLLFIVDIIARKLIGV